MNYQKKTSGSKNQRGAFSGQNCIVSFNQIKEQKEKEAAGSRTFLSFSSHELVQKLITNYQLFL